MTRREGDTIIFERTEPAKCELCWTVAELRPYGPNGASVCFECGMKDVYATAERMHKMLYGEADA